MKIHNFWYVCITVRILLIFLVYVLHKHIKAYTSLILLPIGIGFLYKFITGSNEETQLAKVFWHETRLVHAALYILASLYVIKDKVYISLILLVLDVLFSILYRFLLKK